MSKQEEKLVVTVGGRLLYPIKEDDTLRFAIEMSKITEANLKQKVSEVFDEDDFDNPLVINEDEHSGLPLLNVKSKYDIAVFDKDKNKIDVELYHGAEVYANITIKPYTYKKKTGLTAYISGVVLLENGEPNTGSTYDSIMNNVI